MKLGNIHESSQRNEILKLQRALNCLKEAPKCWKERVDQFSTNNGFRRSKHDFCLYVKNDVFLLIFVDDIIVVSNSVEISVQLK